MRPRPIPSALSRSPVIAAVFVSCALTASAGPAPDYQQGPKLVGAGAVGNPTQGTSVALSADGNTTIVGGSGDNSSAGAAWVYVRSGGVWSQQGTKLVGTGSVGNAAQGFSVALSGDGNTAIVGGYVDNSNAGAVWVFTRSGGVWSQQGTKLVGSGAVGGARQGYSVALSADGNTAVVGGPTDFSNAGAAWVYTRSLGVWSQQGAKLVGSGAAGAALQGVAVALSADGNTAILGGYGDIANVGAAWVFTRSAGVWSQQGGKLVGTGAVSSAQQGISVALSADGNTAAVGGFADDTGLGAAWVYTRSLGVWSQQGAKLVGSGALGAANQGVSVALSADGNTALVGGYGDNSLIGATWVYTRNAGVWTQPGTKLVGAGAVGSAREGASAALSADGRTAIIGAWADNTSIGAAWVFIDPAPSIADIRDIPNDQGGKVKLSWDASLLDYPQIAPVVDHYWVFRSVPPQRVSPGPARDLPMARLDLVPLEAGNPVRFESRLGAQTIYWEQIAQIPATHFLQGYSYVAATTADSVAGSNPFTLFMVVALDATNAQYWLSDPDSGYSVDNLPPVAPAPFTGAYSAGATNLHWGENSEADLAGYRLYRGSSAGFVPGPGNLIAAKPDTGFSDIGPAGSYYKLSAVDIHGNESGFTLLTPGTTLDAGGGALPHALALAAPRPNPASDRTMLSFALPAAGPVRLAVYDMEGRRVRTVSAGVMDAGEHELRFDLRDDAGRAITSGIYFVRLEMLGRTLTRRLAILD